MKKSLLPMLLASTLVLSGVNTFAQVGRVAAEETTTAAEHDHDHDHDHDHEFEFDPAMVVKKDGDNYIMAHGDHYHTIPASDLSEEQIKAADENLAAHPELAEAYDLKKNIYAGYFEDDQVKDRELTDWEGEWQSVFPFLQDGTLDPVMEKKASAEGATMDEEAYKAYYTTGYETDVDHITIDKDQITFTMGDKKLTGTYEYAGYKILQYKKGNRGVRFLFTKVDGDEEAPKSVQFSDHNIAPTEDLMHFHIFFSNDEHDKLLEEMEHWPTFYPSDWTGDQILVDQLNH